MTPAEVNPFAPSVAGRRRWIRIGGFLIATAAAVAAVVWWSGRGETPAAGGHDMSAMGAPASAEAKPVALTPTEQQRIGVTFAPVTAGRVMRVPENVPVEGVVVTVQPGGLEQRTDRFGRFDFGWLPAARYRIDVVVPDWGPFSSEVMLRAGSNADIAVQVQPKPPTPPGPVPAGAPAPPPPSP